MKASPLVLIALSLVIISLGAFLLSSLTSHHALAFTPLLIDFLLIWFFTQGVQDNSLPIAFFQQAEFLSGVKKGFEAKSKLERLS